MKKPFSLLTGHSQTSASPWSEGVLNGYSFRDKLKNKETIQCTFINHVGSKTELKWDMQWDAQEFKGQSTMQLYFKVFSEHSVWKHWPNTSAAHTTLGQAQGDDWRMKTVCFSCFHGSSLIILLINWGAQFPLIVHIVRGVGSTSPALHCHLGHSDTSHWGYSLTVQSNHSFSITCVAHLGNYLRIISTSWNCCSLTHHILILEYDRLSLKEWSWLLTKPSMSVTRPGRTGSSKELSCRMGREQRAAITSSTKLWKTLWKLWENFAHKTSYSIPISFINAKVPPNINKALKVLAWVRTLVSELLRREISYEIPEEFWHLLDVSFNFCNKNLKLLMLLHARPSSVLTAPIDMYALHLLTKINYWEFYPRQPQAAENLSFFFQRWRCTGSCSLPEWTTSYGIGHDHMNFQ